MKINASAASDVLKSFVQEDRAETRIYRGRVQNVTYSLAVASFAISAFIIGTVRYMSADQLRNITLLIDLGLVAVMVIFFWRLKCDLILLRKTMKARQNLLNSLHEDTIQEINPFPSGKDVEPDITDSDLYWVVGLSVMVVLLKMSVIVINATSFVVTKGTP